MSTVCQTDTANVLPRVVSEVLEEVPQGIWPTDGGLKLSVQEKSSGIRCRPVRYRVVEIFEILASEKTTV